MSINKKRLKVLLYGNFFGAYRSQNLVKYLLDAGYRLSIISPEFYYERGEKKDIISKMLRVIFSAYYLIDLFLKAALADVIYLLPLNSELIRPVVWASRLFKTKLVVEMYISAYDTLVREKQEVPIDSAAAKKLWRDDVLALSAADHIVHLARYELNYWKELFNITLVKDNVWIAPLFCEPVLTRLSYSAVRGDRLRICWWGTLIPSHGISNILKALQILHADGIPFSCQLFGIPPKGREQLAEDCRDEIKALGLNDLVSLRKDLTFGDSSLPEYLVNNCDLALGLFGDTEKAGATIPNKLIEALTLGIPSLTMTTSSLEEFFDLEVDLWTCETTPEAIASTMKQISAQTIYQVDWIKTKEKVTQTFSVENYCQTIGEVLNNAATNIVHNR
ncbi:hypothetical protein [Leptothoe sp. PORK10 BA2]|uniref:hypothetical protein n=1 Tax=Leptothoe sp. PORK10 BA2 TaxID=3110254 RepID=UPI002B1EE14E|nr:hypothetical protein [Leptothoe sp. PORK10 BA2]MEA5463859.1 hypothetical protein [Leptothoe sp. PORK10 BA2]